MGNHIQIVHHGKVVWSRDDLAGTHRSNCLCMSCENLKPGQPDNCTVAQELFEFCVRNHMTTPVYECPMFRINKEL